MNDRTASQHVFGSGVSRPVERTGVGAALSLVIAAGTLVGLVTTIIWAAAGDRYYWPRWVWLGCSGVVAPLGVLAHFQALASGSRRWFVLHADIDIALGSFLVLLWCFDPLSVFWPVFPLLGLGVLLSIHALVAFWDRVPLFAGTRQLTERVESLTRSRSGALDLQAAELRRIERDLHDGAQARLVALSMQLGRAETRLSEDSDTAALVRAAREEAVAAIAELRRLVRGIAPPVLSDRGLVAAVQSVAERAPTAVTLSADPIDRLPPVIESAAYFVVAEALTNVAKHAPGAAAEVTVRERHGRLIVEIVDHGPGGADGAGAGGADGAGAGLSGLRARVEALDGAFSLRSPLGGPTVLHAEMPCAS